MSNAELELPDYDPAQAEARFHLANILKALGRLPQAVAEYDRALADAPDHAGAATNDHSMPGF